MANISITLYDGNIDIGYDCSGAVKCEYALWEEMPIEDNEHCAHRYCGSCRSISAQIKALERIKRRISKQSKELKELEWA